MFAKELVRACQVYVRLFDDNGNRLSDSEKINTVLAEKSCFIKRFAYTVQSNDIHMYIHRVMAPECSGETVTPAHIRLHLEFVQQSPQQLSNIAKWFDVPEEDVFPACGRWEDGVLALTFDGDPTKEKFSPEGITASFDVQSAIDYAIEQKKLEYTFSRMLYGNDRRLLPCSEVEKIRNRLLTKTQPFFDSPYGKAELNDWIWRSVF